MCLASLASLRGAAEGLKAPSSGRSLKSLIFDDFTRKISKNGHFWGLAKMARPPKGARPSVNRGGFILRPFAIAHKEKNFYALRLAPPPLVDVRRRRHLPL
jgi:hypothetical protein